MERLSSDMEQQEQQQVEWKIDKVQELCSKGRYYKYCKFD
jgi:hypothetical protein